MKAIHILFLITLLWDDTIVRRPCASSKLGFSEAHPFLFHHEICFDHHANDDADIRIGSPHDGNLDDRSGSHAPACPGHGKDTTKPILYQLEPKNTLYSLFPAPWTGTCQRDQVPADKESFPGHGVRRPDTACQENFVRTFWFSTSLVLLYLYSQLGTETIALLVGTILP